MAIEHIATYGTAFGSDYHGGPGWAAKFTRAVDAAAVYVNASTCLPTASSGLPKSAFHPELPRQGPMGINELTTYKYDRGHRQVRQ